MKKKTDLTSLPDFAVPLIARFLTLAGKNAFFSTNRKVNDKFKLQDPYPVAKLLQYVVNFDQGIVTLILNYRPQLMVTQGCVTVESGTFMKVSAAELVRWCGLRHMAGSMLNILKYEHKHNQQLAEEIRGQWVALDDAYDNNKGILLMLPGSTTPIRSLGRGLARTSLDLHDFKEKLREPLNQEPVAEQNSSHCSIS